VSKRVRRSAEDAKRSILDATERRLLEVGPAGLRIQEIAEDVGISHPAVLHHFGSREALVDAVVERALGGIEQELVNVLGEHASLAPKDALDRVFDMLGNRGHARLIAWLTLTGHAKTTKTTREAWAKIVDATHKLRKRVNARATRENTAFIVVLSALALFGDALSGDFAFANFGLDNAARARFRTWLGALLLDRLVR
jgi:AcrR family transcriptional regulator